MDKIEYAIFYTTKAHKGQKRKQKDIDMIFHPFTVGMILQRTWRYRKRIWKKS